MNLLALDTATKTGWAVSYNGKVIASGVENFSPAKRDHIGKRFAQFRTWLSDMLRDYKIDLVVYEAVVGGRRAGGQTSLVQKGLEALVLTCAYQYAPEGAYGVIPVWSFSPATIKKWATGSGALTHESKIEMVATAHKHEAFKQVDFIPHNPTKSKPWKWDDNQCDALWILDLARAVIDLAIEGTPGWVDGYAAILAINTEDLTPLAQSITNIKWPSNAKKRSKTK